MRYHALVADYHGPLTCDGRISDETPQGLERLRASSRRNSLITGRRLDDLLAVCSCVRLFDLVVAENGGIIYDPATGEETRLATSPSKWLLRGLQARGVTPLEIGQVVVGIGDAENDHSFLQMCECAVAVANAVPSLKEMAAHVTRAENGGGVIELIEQLATEDLRVLEHSLQQHRVALGVMSDGSSVQVAPYGHNLLVAGPSGCGKSTFTAAVVERLIEKEYQVCIIDPEGDYGTLREVIALGNHLRAPSVSEALAILAALPDSPLSSAASLFAS